MRALVVGGDSKLGAALAFALRERNHEVTCTTRRVTLGPRGFGALRRPDAVQLLPFGWVHLDMLDPVLPPGLFDVIYIMAAITGIAPASSNPDAWRVNAEAPVVLAQQARDIRKEHSSGWHVVFMSSGAVERAQETACARQKSYADLAVLMLGGCVFRPLPTVPPAKYGEIADLLVDIGEQRRTGLVRWEG